MKIVDRWQTYSKNKKINVPLYVCIIYFYLTKQKRTIVRHAYVCIYEYVFLSRLVRLLKCKEIIKKKLADEGLEQGGSAYKDMPTYVYLCLCSIPVLGSYKKVGKDTT